MNVLKKYINSLNNSIMKTITLEDIDKHIPTETFLLDVGGDNLNELEEELRGLDDFDTLDLLQRYYWDIYGDIISNNKWEYLDQAIRKAEEETGLIYEDIKEEEREEMEEELLDIILDSWNDNGIDKLIENSNERVKEMCKQIESFNK